MPAWVHFSLLPFLFPAMSDHDSGSKVGTPETHTPTHPSIGRVDAASLPTDVLATLTRGNGPVLGHKSEN